jgi:hypothetical protein
MEKRSTCTPRRRAAQKWPNSCTKIDPPKNSTTSTTEPRLEIIEWKRSVDMPDYSCGDESNEGR